MHVGVDLVVWGQEVWQQVVVGGLGPLGEARKKSCGGRKAAASLPGRAWGGQLPEVPCWSEVPFSSGFSLVWGEITFSAPFSSFLKGSLFLCLFVL